jgi:predicted phosphohydrolase
MKIQYCSDLHLEFPENRKFLLRNPLKPIGDILLLAGDIVPFHDQEKARGFFDFVSDHFSTTYWIPGNHEYYGSDIADKPSPLWEDIHPNVHLVNNQSVELGGIRFIFSTLWSRISPPLEWDIQRCINDFSAISCDGEKFTARNFTRLHKACLAFITKSLESKEKAPCVVVTHHVPTMMNYPNLYKNSVLTQAFAVELFDLIDHFSPAYWIYGHHHVNTPEFKAGPTTMLTNQLGYVHHYEYRSFRRDAVFELCLDQFSVIS